MRQLRKGLAATALLGIVVLVATAALGTDPGPPAKAGTVVNPQPGQIVAVFPVLEDGTCDLGADGLTLSPSAAGPLAVEFDDECRAVLVDAGADPGTAPEGRTIKATP